MIKVALDAFGGDYAPDVCIEGAVNVVKKHSDIHVVLCGPEAQVKAGLEKFGYAGNGISVVDAPDLVAMDEHPVMVVKKKQKSGLVMCVALQKKGLVDASVSAGNSGAMMASCLMLLGKSTERFGRPPIGCALPTKDRRIVLVDAGANVDERASTIVDFAIAGSAFAETYLGYSNPTVGLLNMGEEEHKGPAVLQEAHQLLKSAPVNFIGNIEGRDLIAGKADVVACSGYTGNVVLKLLEGFFELHQEMFGTIDTPAGKRFAEMWDYRATGGALLLGLNGTGIIAHGRSDALAIEKAVEVAAKYAEMGVAKKVNERLSAIKDDDAPAQA
ncbi:MAG: phosphate acyltransferase PlsX [Fibrobacter sp.]|uniref:phosphate acyltransferase PlsX n=1 Tax=Fibrobacter sp. UWP2 TaxID=1896216 RepID=UPI000921C85C|nr:phosphate acyltransferase PlsX [Fibrobacter sp. UWP2]MBO7384212.1 phosphate acyltransferase PlsX [Fibrobacter sp.]SHJ19006.1 phosphate:acyl-[acyl carrier protein] acyltransferase [Fibrobacter sp. UWP2]